MRQLRVVGAGMAVQSLSANGFSSNQLRKDPTPFTKRESNIVMLQLMAAKIVCVCDPLKAVIDFAKRPKNLVTWVGRL